MKCRKCPAKAVLKIERHHTALCKGCFNDYMHQQVERAASEGMFGRDDRILVAVSGGKDSLALWDILLNLGYPATGLHVNLGIGGYSTSSLEKTRRFSATRGAPLIVHGLREEIGAGIPEISGLTDRPACGACGVIKRYSFNRIASERGFSVVATGHNLDDEAARLLGNVLHWQEDYLAKQSPILSESEASPDHPGANFVKKVKPLYRLAERELAAYCVLNRIDYIVEECPNANGAKILIYKEAMNRLEEEAPGTKQNFYFSFLKRRKPSSAESGSPWATCRKCGQPTSVKQTGDRASAPLCGYCRLVERIPR
jgi:uncharacterized protein (TIGR00269 family)